MSIKRRIERLEQTQGGNDIPPGELDPFEADRILMVRTDELMTPSEWWAYRQTLPDGAYFITIRRPEDDGTVTHLQFGPGGYISGMDNEQEATE